MAKKGVGMMTLDAFLRHVAGLPAAVSRAEQAGLRAAAATIADAGCNQ